MLQRMGIGQMAKAGARTGCWPDDIDFDLELLVERMTRLLLIEISAFHAFAWAEELLDDPDLVAGDGEAARLSATSAPTRRPTSSTSRPCSPRCGTARSSARRASTPAPTSSARTWDRALAESLGERRQETLDVIRGEVAHAARAAGADADDLWPSSTTSADARRRRPTAA